MANDLKNPFTSTKFEFGWCILHLLMQISMFSSKKLEILWITILLLDAVTTLKVLLGVWKCYQTFHWCLTNILCRRNFFHRMHILSVISSFFPLLRTTTAKTLTKKERKMIFCFLTSLGQNALETLLFVLKTCATRHLKV